MSAAASSTTSLNESLEQNLGKFVTYELAAYGVKINYPSNWSRVEKGLKPPMIVGFNSPKEDPSDTFLDGISIALQTTANRTLEQVMQSGINSLKNKPGDFALIEFVPN